MKNSIIKHVLMKRRQKAAPIAVDEDQDMVGVLKGGDVDSVVAQMEGNKPMEESDVQEMKQDMLDSKQSDKKEGKGSAKPLTLKVEVEDNDDTEEKDLAPGVPANPQDPKSDAGDNKEALHSALVDAIMGGYSEEEIKSRHGGNTLKGKMRQAALKQR